MPTPEKSDLVEQMLAEERQRRSTESTSTTPNGVTWRPGGSRLLRSLRRPGEAQGAPPSVCRRCRNPRNNRTLANRTLSSTERWPANPEETLRLLELRLPSGRPSTKAQERTINGRERGGNAARGCNGVRARLFVSFVPRVADEARTGGRASADTVERLAGACRQAVGC